MGSAEYQCYWLLKPLVYPALHLVVWLVSFWLNHRNAVSVFEVQVLRIDLFHGLFYSGSQQHSGGVNNGFKKMESNSFTHPLSSLTTNQCSFGWL